MAAQDPENVNEEELRRQIRAEIEERDQQRQRKNQQRETARSANAEAEKRRRIYQEELQRYYQDRPGFQPVVNEDGETDWVPEAEAQQNAKLFDEVLEDPDEARGRMKWIVGFTTISILLCAIVIYYILRETTGNVLINCNIPEAQVILDTTPLDRFAGDLIKDVPTGDHVVTVTLNGYIIQGDPVRRFKSREGKTEILSFILIPDTAVVPSTTSGLDKSKGKR